MNKSKTHTFLEVLYLLRRIDPEFPLQYAICIAEISKKEGISLSELAGKTEMPVSTVSRIVGALSDKRQNGQPYQLVSLHISPNEKRRKEIYLSRRGHDLIRQLSNILPQNRD